MTWQEINDYNQSGLAGTLSYPANITPLFTPMLLISIFMIITLGTYFAQKRFGRSDFISCLAMGSFTTATIAVTMTTIEGMISGITLGITVGVAIVSVLLLMTQGNRE